MQGTQTEIAASLVSLLSGDNGSLGTAAALQQCLGLHIANDEDFQPHTLALALLSHGKAKQQAAAAAAQPGHGTANGSSAAAASQADSAAPRLLQERSTPHAGPPGASDGADDASKPAQANQVANAALREAEAAYQVVAMLAAEAPTCLTGLVSKLLSQAFPSTRELARSALLQKWAMDVLFCMAGDARVASEVCQVMPAQLVLAWSSV